MCLGLTIISAGCSNDDDDFSLYNTWILVSYGNESNEVLKEANGYFYHITFNSDGTFSGQAYGNKMEGKYECIGNQIKFIDTNTTQIELEGSDPDMSFWEHWDDVYAYKISASQLRLYYSDDQYFKFRNHKVSDTL